MLVIQNLSYLHPNKDLLFEEIQLSIHAGEKMALIGANGVGKSTLMKLITGALKPTSGTLFTKSKPYYIPQIFGQFNHLTIAESLQVDLKLQALEQIINGDVSEKNYDILNEDWDIEERCREALHYWQLDNQDLSQPLNSLSGGQKTKLFLAGITIHQPELVLLDEPSNHLDLQGRKLLYHFIESSDIAILIVSHDRKLLNLTDSVSELTPKGIRFYGGNYDFYKEQKQIEWDAHSADIQNKEKAFKKAKEKEKETIERQQKLNARGRQKQEKAGVPKIAMKSLQNKGELTASKLKSAHSEKIDSIKEELNLLRSEVIDNNQMKIDFDYSKLHEGKLLVQTNGINYQYENSPFLWEDKLDIEIYSGERLVIKGSNGSGKTTLIKVLLGELIPQIGHINRKEFTSIYIDQEYSIIQNNITIYEQIQRYNHDNFEEHELKTRLHRFLFPKETWDKKCEFLSGGERMRLMLCCLSVGNQAPDMIILDEPTNNLDIQNMEILTAALSEYQGTLLVISHDETFIEEIHAERSIVLSKKD
jgi:ATPase subunit of ABC transporter with duplicated ATPase domains